MTITLQAVNELIQSLESAGELSIREQKFLKLAKAYQQPAADSEPVIVVGDDGGDALSYRRLIQSFEPGTKLYRHAQPVQAVPGKWIPVSERLPENKPGSYEYLVFETLNNQVNHDYWNVPDKGDDAFSPFWNYYGENVTHWMPLPAAPKEVKNV
ncbi:TPA: DUF551 domain-containing protein [Klebsiella pneumoniae]|nr:DUF551 domain-containing protein [Klebsiella pneumoniae]HBX7627478.1 DUF551 domain-containing protein [Klebsiella pneumoniae]